MPPGCANDAPETSEAIATSLPLAAERLMYVGLSACRLAVSRCAVLGKVRQYDDVGIGLLWPWRASIPGAVDLEYQAQDSLRC